MTMKNIMINMAITEIMAKNKKLRKIKIFKKQMKKKGFLLMSIN